MDFDLSEQEKMIQRAAREFAQRAVLPQAMEIDRSGQFPLQLALEMGGMGYYGLPYPSEYGGSGAGYVAYSLVVEQLCQASMTAGAIVAVSALSEESLFRFGNERQKREFLVPLTTGQVFGCFCFTEPGTGSDPKAVTTRAKPVGNEYVVEGQKNFIAVSPVASVATVFAKDETARISAFIVPTAVTGFVLREPCETLGLRGLGTSVIYLDGVRIPQDNMLGAKGSGFEIMLEAISVERIGVAAQGVGVAQAALDLSIDYAKQRCAYSRPIAEMPTIQWLISEMAARIEAGRWLAYRTAFLRNKGESVRHTSSVAKLFCSQMAVEVTRMAMQVHGSYGTMKTMPVERMYRDAKMTELYVGVSEIQRAIIARDLLRQ
ncbi:MAG: acyl-CoA dehydrogenase [Chloroflexi bacterium]|nr:acyl-CoA dehydrogenase [Chloroflexota bacterium]